jgi:hypothetical protein
MDANGDRLDVQFLASESSADTVGTVRDHFTLTKSSVPNAPPTVSLTAPLEGAVFQSPAEIALQATAADTDGLVSKVEFFAGPTRVGEATAEPFAFAWCPRP